MTYDELVAAVRQLSSEERLMLIAEVARLLLEELQSEKSYLKDAPVTRSLLGILPPDASIEEYHRYLDKKYGDALTSVD